MSARRRGPAVVLLLGLLVSAIAPALSASAVGVPVSAGGGYHVTKTLTRSFGLGGGGTSVVDSRTVSVSVDKTTQLQGRERVRISWSGAHPSAGRAANPFGEAGLNQEYPVVILQCRGLDNPALPQAQQLSPDTCWTSTQLQRSQRTTSGDAIWTRDLYADPADQQVKSGATPYPATACQDTDPTAYVHITPFVAASGKRYAGCTSDTMPPEAAVGASFPPAEQSAFTDLDGTGTTQFEVRSSVENESLGCSHTVACSIVVIPIMGLSCAAKDPAYATADRNCRRAGQKLPGSNNFAGDGVDASVSPLYWWAASNWRNRFSVPISFALPPGACDLLDPRAPTPFYGSELLSQAALQWAPAYCLRKDRFKWQQNSMPDDAAFALMEGGGADAAEVSGPRQLSGTDTVGYAPTAVTGFAISYVIDRPDNAGEYTNLRLNARLLAKLLTESYPASSLGQQHPGLANNPRSMNLDPEFQALNPGLSLQPSEAAATLMALSNQADVISTLTSYIAHDPAAVAFVDGKPDPWGMKVNPAYQGTTLPTSQWQLKDTFVPKSSLQCYQQNPAPYLPQVAAPVSSLRQIASAVLDSWPLVQTKCDRALPTDPWKLGRVDREGMGSRFMLGITTLGDAQRFGLDTAALQVKPGSYVRPGDTSMAAAVALATPGATYQPFSIDQARVRASSTAYPGTMVVYTAARLHGMAASDAAKVAQFIRVSTSEGQVPGRGNGQLADGYLPIRSTGVTARLYSQAQSVAAAVAAQKASAVPRTHHRGTHPTSGTGTGAPASSSSGSSAPAGAAPTSSAGGPVAAHVTKASTLAGTTPVSSPARTGLIGSGVAGWLLPLLLGLGVAGAVLSGLAKTVLRARGVR